jgi:hypothetical protein
VEKIPARTKEILAVLTGLSFGDHPQHGNLILRMTGHTRNELWQGWRDGGAGNPDVNLDTLSVACREALRQQFPDMAAAAANHPPIFTSSRADLDRWIGAQIRHFGEFHEVAPVAP